MEGKQCGRGTWELSERPIGGDYWQHTERRDLLLWLTGTERRKPPTTTCPQTRQKVRELTEGPTQDSTTPI